MKLKRSLPPNRSFEQIKNHYLIEKAIAKKLKESDRKERMQIYATMYDELFSKVPDHPRLNRRKSKQLTDNANRDKYHIVNKFFDKSYIFAEFAPGDCKFASSISKHFKQAYGIDISDQRNPEDKIPENFKLIVYDGYNLDGIQNNSVDIIFSDQLIEHFHHEDTRLHFELAKNILKPGGKYIFRTPHSITGPHDVSKFFSDEPECFHLKEWTYIEIKKMIKGLNYSKLRTYWYARGIGLRMPYTYFAISEKCLGQIIPKRYIRFIARYLIPSIYGVAIK